MKKISIATALVMSVLSTTVTAESNNNFGRQHLFIGSDPALTKLMLAVADNVGEKSLKGKPDVRLFYAKRAFKQLCRGNKADFPDMVASIREMTLEEYKRCQEHEVGSIIKLKIGYEALVVAANKKGLDINLDEKKLFKAIAADVPDEKKNITGVLTVNPYKTWNEIDADAPKKAIKVLGPADKSRTERTVKMLGMELGCRTWDWVPELKHVQRSYALYRQLCWVQRKDDGYVKAEVAGTDLTKALLADKGSIGLIDFNSWQKSKDKLKAYSIAEMPPTLATISKGLYPLSRAYYVYIKVDGLKKVQGLSHFMNELVGDKALAEDGYLASIGMIAMSEKERKREVEQASEFIAMSAPEAE